MSELKNTDNRDGRTSSGLRDLLTKATGEYGMLLVLLLLVAALSMLTLTERSPAGADAGAQVANLILGRYEPGSRIVVVAESTDLDLAFVSRATEVLTDGGMVVAGQATGRPIEVRRAIEAARDSPGGIDAVAATGDLASLPFLQRIEGLPADIAVGPQPESWPTFLTSENLLNVANQTAVYAIIAIGMTMVIISAGIDLGVGSLVALSSVLAADITMRLVGSTGGFAAVAGGFSAALVVCGFVGFLNGLFVTRFRIPPFIVTLAMMMIAKGLARRITNEGSVEGLPEAFQWIGGRSTLAVPNAVWLMAVLYAAAHFVMSRTIFGRCVYAVGGNAEAARLSGVSVSRVLLTVYTLCGVLAGLGGLVQSSKLAVGDPKLGVNYELEVIAAVVVGGTSLSGGQGRVLSTLIGAFIIAVMKNGMNLMGIRSANQLIVLGAVVLAAVLIDTLKRRS